MGYHITLNRPEPSTGISEQEWRDFVTSRPELKIVKETANFITVILDGDDSLALHYSTVDASVFTNNPKGPRIIEYMASIAPHFGGVVTGDEGETFSSRADWGTQSDWDSQPIFAEKPFFMNDEFTLVDCCVAPILWRLKVVDIALPERSSRPLLKYMLPLFFVYFSEYLINQGFFELLYFKSSFIADIISANILIIIIIS